MGRAVWITRILSVVLGLIPVGDALAQPSALDSHAAVYDPMEARMLVIAGNENGQLVDRVWECRLTGSPRWNEIVIGNAGPPARAGLSATYDPVRDRVIVFGGLSADSAFNDVWALALRPTPSWTRLTPAGSPPLARSYHSAIYDPNHDRILIFGGQSYPAGLLGDLWALSVSASPVWTQLLPTGQIPSARYGHTAVLDSIQNRMIVFGGGVAPMNDCLALALGGSTLTWSRIVTPSSGPPERFGHTAIFDPIADQMIIFGGFTLNQQLNDLWKLHLGSQPNWIQVAPSLGGPSERYVHSAIFDIGNDRMVMFGGFPVATSDLTWALSLRGGMEWFPERPVLRTAGARLELPAVTLGDTLRFSLILSSGGMDSVHVVREELPAAFVRTSPSAGIGLGWRDVHMDSLLFVPSRSGSHQDTITIVSDDPASPRSQIEVQTTALGLVFSQRVLGSPPEVPLGLAFPVVVSPAPGVRLQRCTLWYRTVGSGPGFDSLAFAPLASDFIAVVPARAVSERGVEYYVEVVNGEYRATLPVTAPFETLLQRVAAPASVAAAPRPTSGADFLVGRAIEVQVVLPAGADFASGFLFYRKGGEAAFAVAPILKLGPGLPSALVPDSVVGARGVEYRLEVATATRSGQPLRFPADSSAVAVLPVKTPDLTESLEHPAERYRMLSLPLELDADFTGSMGDILANQFGSPDITRWRAFIYRPELQITEEYGPSTGPDFRAIPGRAFWLVTRSRHRAGTGRVAGHSVPSGQEYPIRLAAGWNMIGDPFEFPVSWVDVRRNSANVDGLTAYDPTQLPRGGYRTERPLTLIPFEGYFLHAIHADTIWVRPREAAAVTSTGPTAAEMLAQAAGVTADPAAPAWDLVLTARSEAATDSGNVLGEARGASASRDLLDRLKPPAPPGPWVSLAFDHSDWGENSGLYWSDLRGTDGEGERWDLQLRSSSAGEPVTIVLSDPTRSPSRPIVRFIDDEQGIVLGEWESAAPRPQGGAGRDPVPALTHRVLSWGGRPYRLSVVAGTREYVEQTTRVISPVPTALSFDRPVPNPFGSATRFRFGLARPERVTLEIFDAAGRRVWAPIQHELMDSGFHALLWDGRASHGGLAADGLYLARLTAGTQVRSARVVLLR